MSENKDQGSTSPPDSITLVEKRTGQELKLIRIVDAKGVAFYEAPLNPRADPD
jgi:hypothetical protein